ncbi:MAG: hypothetical protein K0Q68_325 [Moraxellaceae bacterium]|jgi:hypothetical protein|nr:hypothetical protein [Moraxellaceae bacterium]
MLRYALLVMMWLGLPVLAAAEAAAKPPALLLVPAIYGLKSDAGTGKPAHIHDDFLRAIGASATTRPEAVIARLRARFDEAFALEKVERITPANKYRTYAVSLEVLRADQYQVSRPDGTVDIYLPVSLRLYVTSLLSGEVLYSRALTSYRNRNELKEDLLSGAAATRIDADYLHNVLELVDRVIAETRQQFQPFQVRATVVGRPLGLYVVDRGMDAGIGKGTELVNASGAGIRILHTGKTYAVGEATLGDIQSGEELAMYSTAAAADIVKPRALVMNADTPADLPGAYAAVQFAENLGNRVAFTVVPVNPDFQSVLQFVATTEGVQQAEVTQKRVLPDYFVRIKIPEPEIYQLPTSKGFSKVRVLVGSAWAELLDRQGRVVYVTQASEQIEDQILEGGIAFESADRRKVLYGNLLKTLGEQFIRDVSFRQDSLTVTTAGEQVQVADPQRSVSAGQSLRLYRPLTLAPVTEPVLVPVWDMTAQAPVAGMVALERQLPVAQPEEKIRKGDVVLLQVSGAGSGEAQAAALCPTLQDKGAIALRDVRALAYFAIGSGSRLPFLGGDTSLSYAFPTLSSERDRLQRSGFASPLAGTVASPALCYQPLIKIDELSRRCDDGSGLCEVELQIAAGVNLLHQGQPAGRKILQAKSQLRNVPQADSATFIQIQASQKLYPLLVDSVRQLALPAADALTQPTAQGN